MKTCVWVTPKGQCGEKVSYKMADDGGEKGASKVRKYNAFCEEHKKRVKELEETDE